MSTLRAIFARGRGAPGGTAATMVVLPLVLAFEALGALVEWLERR